MSIRLTLPILIRMGMAFPTVQKWRQGTDPGNLPTPTNTFTTTPTPGQTATTSPSSTAISTSTPTHTPGSNTPSPTATHTATPTPSATTSPFASDTPTPTAIPTTEPSPTAFPVAVDDSFITIENSVLNTAPNSVLDNDSISDGSSLYAILFNNPSNGSLALNSNGTFIYTPDPGFFGMDSFTYRVRSESNSISSPATVFITVYEVTPTPTFTPSHTPTPTPTNTPPTSTPSHTPFPTPTPFAMKFGPIRLFNNNLCRFFSSHQGSLI